MPVICFSYHSRIIIWLIILLEFRSSLIVGVQNNVNLKLRPLVVSSDTKT